jgi:hypothetical protein
MPCRWLQLLNFTDIVTLKFSYLRNADNWKWWFVTDAPSGLHAAQALMQQPNCQNLVRRRSKTPLKKLMLASENCRHVHTGQA